MKECKICHNITGNSAYTVREMMFGSHDEFEYVECAKCGCLQISEIPVNINQYYPSNYYSFKAPKIVKSVRAFRHRAIFMYLLKKRNIVSHFVTRIYRTPDIVKQAVAWIKDKKLTLDSDILDVGCASGELLLRLSELGFSNLTGIDPFINQSFVYKKGVRILKKKISYLDGHFDFIMFNHSFEHMPDPCSIFSHLSRLLKPNGIILIRTPTVSSFAWRHYRTNWVQLDAPRHLFLHSTKSIEWLANMFKFKIESIEFDSSDFQFWGSEQYIKNISLRDERSFAVNPSKSIFTPHDIREFEKRSIELNASSDGDQACFYIRNIR